MGLQQFFVWLTQLTLPYYATSYIKECIYEFQFQYDSKATLCTVLNLSQISTLRIPFTYQPLLEYSYGFVPCGPFY